MPLCTVCAHPADYLYTTYKTKSNIRLGVCVSLNWRQRLTEQPRCGNFLDPLIEHPPLLLLLDLILLKPRVYLHLLFNRGSKPFDADHVVTSHGQEVERSRRLRSDFTTLAFLTIVAETLGRAQRERNLEAPGLVGAIMALVLVVGELVIQHVVTAGLALLALKWKRWYPAQSERRNQLRDGRQEYFAYVQNLPCQDPSDPLILKDRS